MAGYEVVNAPGGMSYGAPLVDFSTLANWPNAYYRGQENRRQQDIATAFQNGLPVDSATGAPDYGKIMQILAQKGDINAIPQLGQLQQQAALRNQAGQVSPLLSGASPAAPQPAALPAAAAPQPAPTSPITVASLPAPPASGLNSGDVSGSVVDVVTAKLPQDSGVTGAVINNIARAVGVDANAPLTPAQSARVQQLTDAYVRRRGPASAPAAAPAATPSAPSRIDATFADMAARSTNGETTMPPASAALAARTANGAGQEPAAQAPPAPAVATAAAPTPAVAPAVAPAAATAPPAAAQPPGRPIMPQVPLPRGFNDPQQAIMALRTEAARLSTNPYATGQVKLLEDWANRIETSIKPIPVRPGETLLDPRNGQPLYQAPTTNPQNMILQRFLAENPNATPEQIQAFIQSGRGGRSAIAMYMNRFLQEHPDATADEVKRAAQLYTTQATAQNRFLSGPQGNTVRSLNVVVSHLDTMQTLADDLKNGNIVAFNRIAQRWAEETGSSAPTDFDTAKQIVGSEIIKALGIAGAGTKDERQEAADAFNRARSPSQIGDVIKKVIRPLLVGQISGLRRQFVASTGLPGESFDEMLEPSTREFFGQIERTSPPANAPGAGADNKGWVTLPSGVRYREKPAQQ